MKKRSYRQTDVNHADWAQIQQCTENRATVFSVDVAKNDFVGLLSTRDEGVICTLKWCHPQDTARLLERLCTELKAASLEVVMEPSGVYGDVLRWQFSRRGIDVYFVSPKHVHDQAESFDGVPSMHDAKSVHIIADLHLRGRSKLWEAQSDNQRDMRALTDELDVCHQEKERNNNRLLALLARHWPELEGICNVQTISVLTLLSEYGEPAEVQAKQHQAAALLRKVGHSFLREEKIQAIIQGSAQTLGVPCTLNEREHIKSLAKCLLNSHQLCLSLDKRMAKLLAAHPDWTATVKLCGTATAAILWSILGDIKKYPHAGSVVKAVGLNLKERSSGKHRGVLKITKRGSGRARFYLYWLAMRLIDKDPYVKAWYERKVKANGKRAKRIVITAVMRKVTKALWHVAHGADFDSSLSFPMTDVVD